MTSSGFEIPPDQKSFQTESIFDFSSPVIMVALLVVPALDKSGL